MFQEILTDAERLKLINDHRDALDHPRFQDLSEAELQHHERLIDENAPFGNDPWENEEMLS